MVDVVVVGHYQVVLALGQSLRHPAPDLVLPDHGLVLGPLVEVLVLDADPLLALAALPRGEEAAVLGVEVGLVDADPGALLVVEREGVVEEEEA